MLNENDAPGNFLGSLSRGITALNTATTRPPATTIADLTKEACVERGIEAALNSVASIFVFLGVPDSLQSAISQKPHETTIAEYRQALTNKQDEKKRLKKNAPLAMAVDTDAPAAAAVSAPPATGNKGKPRHKKQQQQQQQQTCQHCQKPGHRTKFSSRCMYYDPATDHRRQKAANVHAIAPQQQQQQQQQHQQQHQQLLHDNAALRANLQALQQDLSAARQAQQAQQDFQISGAF